MLDYNPTVEFDKDFKKLKKRFLSLDKDFETFKKYALEMLHEKSIDNGTCVKIEGFCPDKNISYKVRKFSCKSLKSKGVRSGIRIIYVHELDTNKIHFIEIYYHEKEDSNFDRDRLQRFLEGLK